MGVITISLLSTRYANQDTSDGSREKEVEQGGDVVGERVDNFWQFALSISIRATSKTAKGPILSFPWTSPLRYILKNKADKVI